MKDFHVVGIGNALMDALVVIEGADALIDELGLVRGTTHMVDDTEWVAAHQRVSHHEIRFESGGSCANTIATLGRLGARARYCGQVGDDLLGRTYAERMTDACGGHALRIDPVLPTGKCLSIISAEDAERTMLTDLGAAVHMPSLGDFKESIRRAQVAHFTGYTLLDGPMHDVVKQAMRIAKDAGATISLDVADPFVVQVIRDRLWHVIDAFADIVFLNADESRALTDKSPEAACAMIAREARVATVVVKLGKRGSIVAHGGTMHRVQADLVRAIDTTGAGDAYAGGYLYGLTHGWDPARSGALASAVAARTVAQLGAVVADNEALRGLASLHAPRNDAA